MLPLVREEGDPAVDSRANVPADVHQIAHHRAPRGHHARPGSVEKSGPHGVALYEDGIERTAHRGEEVIGGKQGGMDPGFDGPSLGLGNGQEFDLVSQFLCVLNVHRGDPRDSLRVDIFQMNLDSVGQGNQDTEFMGRIHAPHIQGGVCFGNSQFLGLF